MIPKEGQVVFILFFGKQRIQAKKYFFKTNDEITNIGHDVKKINDDLLEQLIITPIPPIVEKDIMD